jgi:hypothetical protein
VIPRTLARGGDQADQADQAASRRRTSAAVAAERSNTSPYE